MLVRLAWEIGGAVAFGSLVGALFALYLRYIGREITLVLLAVCALLSQIGTSQRLEPLLAALIAGLVIENLAVSLAGRQISSMASRACGPSRCTTLLAPLKIHPSRSRCSERPHTAEGGK